MASETNDAALMAAAATAESVATSVLKFTKRLMKGSCDGCGKVAVYACGDCHKAWYCSEDCQNEMWVIHKLGCVPQMGIACKTQKPQYAAGSPKGYKTMSPIYARY